MGDLETFRAMLADWNGRMNLVGPSALDDFWLRHAFDSAQLLDLAPRALRWVDLGPGAGFPGVVLAILLKGRPGAVVHLVESMTKRCRFLEAVVAALDLPAEIHNARAEDLAIACDVVVARACAPLVRLFGYARPYLKRGAVGLFLKGQDVAAELRGSYNILAISRLTRRKPQPYRGADRAREKGFSMSDSPPCACSRSPTRRAASARPPPRSIWPPRWRRWASGCCCSTSIPRATPRPASA